MSRKVVLAVAALALLCALPALAGSAAPAAPAPSPACPHSALFELATPAPAASAALPDWLEDATSETSTTHPFRGYCACECSTIKDCNVNADCSNNRCLKAITCC
jgi:hypothetical protein